MKRLYLSLIAIALGLGAMAQDSRVATLQHGTNFRAYYGTDAFISAHTDAADGDVITLTEGEFNCSDITKALTIRGEGMRKTILRRAGGHINIPKDSPYSLHIEGMTMDYRLISGGYTGMYFQSTGGTATVTISKCLLVAQEEVTFENCNAVVIDSEIQNITRSRNNSSIICFNSKLRSLEGSTCDVNNCVINGQANVTNSIIKNSIIYEVSTLDNTNTTNNCLVKDGSSGFANSWYVKTEPDVNPDPWAEDPETPVLWDELFGEDYHLTDAAAATYLGTDGTQVGIYGGAYPWNETPDYPLVKNLEVKGINENGKLQVKINVE